MIARIRNPWIRRTLLLVVLMPAILYGAVRVYWCATAELWAAVRDDVPDAWKGPRR